MLLYKGHLFSSLILLTCWTKYSHKLSPVLPVGAETAGLCCTYQTSHVHVQLADDPYHEYNSSYKAWPQTQDTTGKGW